MTFPKPMPRGLDKRHEKATKAARERHVKSEVKARDHYSCRCCGRKTDLDVHERKTRGAGGVVSRKNSLTLDRVCHTLAQQYRIVIEGSTCEGPLQFVMGARIAKAIFSGRCIPPHVHIVPEGL